MRQKKSQKSQGEETKKEDAKKEFFKEELRRIKEDLEVEKEKVVTPPVREHVPYIHNSLDPYFNTGGAEFMINELEEELPPTPRGYTSRQTALGLCDPWVAHQMELLEEKKDTKKPQTPRKEKDNKKDKDKDRPRKEGSTRLPKYPAVTMPPPEDPNKQIYYSDVPALRETLKKQYGASAEQKTQADYERTKQDFYRMELDRFDEYHPSNINNMRATYFAYLQNTPGSKKAVYECVKAAAKTKS